MFGDQSLQEQGNTATIAGEPCVAQQEWTPATASPRGTPLCWAIILTGQETCKSTCAIATKINFLSSELVSHQRVK